MTALVDQLDAIADTVRQAEIPDDPFARADLVRAALRLGDAVLGLAQRAAETGRLGDWERRP